jgi:glycosyltransferase involved in cell wall biosynthesis
MSDSLTVVMPVRDEAKHLPETIQGLVEAVRRSGFAADVVLVDDGSSDASSDVASAALAERLPLTVVTQPNRGRLLARRAGLEAAGGDWVLLLDGRVRIRPDALAFVERRLDRGARVWTADVTVDANGNPYGTFWKLLAELAWPAYFDQPRETSFGAGDFDRYPKGTTCFLAPHTLLLDALEAFETRYSDPRHANDDTMLLRWVAEREPIHIAPSFGCSYSPRSTLRTFVRHALHRGVVFLDGHGRRESRFFPVAIGFFPVSALLAAAAWRRPSVVPLAALSTSLAAAGLGLARRRSPREIRSLALLAPVYAVAHGLGMWQGLFLTVSRRRSTASATSGQGTVEILGSSRRRPEKSSTRPFASASGLGSTSAPPEAGIESTRPGTA